MKTVTLYVRRNCGHCRLAREVVSQVREQHPFVFEERDVERDLAPDDPRKSPYALDIPVIELDGKVVFRNEVDAEALARLVSGKEDA
jgi:glutaredoxin